MRLSILLVVLMLFFSFSSFFYGDAEAEHVEKYPEAAHPTPGTCTDPENRYSIEVPNNWHDLQFLPSKWPKCSHFATTTGIETGEPSAFLLVNLGDSMMSTGLYAAQVSQKSLLLVEKHTKEFVENFDIFNYTLYQSKIIKLDSNREAYLVQIVHDGESTIFVPSYSKILTMVVIPDGDMQVMLVAESACKYCRTIPSDESKSIMQMIKSFRLLGTPDSIQTPNPTTVTTPPEPDDRSGVGEALFIIIIVVVAIIVIKRRKKKIPIPVQTPPGGGATTSPATKLAGRGKILRRGRLPIMGKFKLPFKRTVGKQPLKQKSEMEPIHLLRCGNMACRMEKFLVTDADGQQYCTKCGWKKR